MNILNKLLAYLCLTLAISTASFAYLSYSFYGDKQSQEVVIESLEQANKDLASDIYLLNKSYAIADNVVLQTYKNNANTEAVGYIGVEAINALQGSKCLWNEPIKATYEGDVRVSVNKQENKHENVQANVADIDDKLPADLTSILQQSYNNLSKGSDSSSPAK